MDAEFELTVHVEQTRVPFLEECTDSPDVRWATDVLKRTVFAESVPSTGYILY